MQTSEKATVVIGAGPGGLSCAVKLVDLGIPVTVLEAAPEVGGLARTLDLWDQRVDVGPHRFFSPDRVVMEHWMRFVGDRFTRVNRLTRILYDGKLIRYPLQPFDALAKIGLPEATRAIASYAYQRLRPIPNPETLEDWVVNRFGRRLFEIFFKTYTEKVWGIPCTQIDVDWAAQRIKKLSLLEAVKSAVFKSEAQKHKTLVDQFVYPEGGSGVVYQRMAEHVRGGGGAVRLGTPVRKVLLDREGGVRGVLTVTGEEVPCGYVVSTMPLTLLVKGLPEVPAPVVEACDRLFYRNTLLVYLEVDSASVFPDNWIYVHAPELRHGRITNFRNWSPSLFGSARTSILCMEYWCFDDDPLWKTEDGTLEALAVRELGMTSLLRPPTRVLRTRVLRLSRSYPVYERGYRAHLAPIQAYVNSIPRLLAVGRYGAFKYNNQDHSILMGLLAAAEISSGQRQQLWEINTDSEYQESAEVQKLFKRGG